MDYYTVYEQLGSEPTVAFGCTPPDETVGPIQPTSVQYGIRYEVSNCPLVHLNFNKYRNNLPPWRNVVEMVAASEDDGGVYEATWLGVTHVETKITGDLKTVTLVAKHLINSFDVGVIERDKVTA